MSEPIRETGFIRDVPAPCPNCGRAQLYIAERLVAEPPDTYSLAGEHVKVTAQWAVFLICRGCGAQARGHLDRGGWLAFNQDEMREGERS